MVDEQKEAHDKDTLHSDCTAQQKALKLKENGKNGRRCDFTVLMPFTIDQLLQEQQAVAVIYVPAVCMLC